MPQFLLAICKTFLLQKTEHSRSPPPTPPINLPSIFHLSIHTSKPKNQNIKLNQMKPSPTSTNSFYAFVSEGLDELERSLSSNTFMSIDFLCHAISFLRSLHSQIVVLVQKLHLPVGDKWLDEYMDETSRIWKACDAIKLGITSFETYCARGSTFLSRLDDCRRHPSPNSVRQVSITHIILNSEFLIFL